MSSDLSKANFNGSQATEPFLIQGQRDKVIKYIITQEEHHKMKTFREEYLKTLCNFGVEYEKKYLFEFYD